MDHKNNTIIKKPGHYSKHCQDEFAFSSDEIYSINNVDTTGKGYKLIMILKTASTCYYYKKCDFIIFHVVGYEKQSETNM